MDFTKFFTVFIIVGFFVACTPKVTEPLVEKTPEVTVPTLTEEQKLCRTFNDLGRDQEEAMTSFVLYKSELKAGNFAAAYPIWQKAFSLAPKADGNKSYHYDDGIKIYIHMAGKTEDVSEKKMWADSVKYLYERKRLCYGENPDFDARESYDLYYNFREVTDESYLMGLYRKVSDAKGNDIPAYTINPFAKVLVNGIVDKTVSVDEGKIYANRLMEAIKEGTAKCTDDCKNWEIINDYAVNRLEVLERFPSFYPCDYYVKKYYAEYEANPTDCETIEKVAIRLKRGGCDEAITEFAKVKAAFSNNCKKVVEKGPLGEAYDFYRNGQYEEAIDKFDEYFSIETDKDKLAKNQLVVAKIYYRDIKDFPKARKYALDAAKNKSNWGDPYILIGKLYASSGPICGPGTGWDSQIVTWPAIDKWNYAKKIDSSVSNEANKLMNTYRQYMPAVEDIFSRPNVKEGGPFYVGCWIKENTTVRAAK